MHDLELRLGSNRNWFKFARLSELCG